MKARFRRNDDTTIDPDAIYTPRPRVGVTVTNDGQVRLDGGRDSAVTLDDLEEFLYRARLHGADKYVTIAETTHYYSHGGDRNTTIGYLSARIPMRPAVNGDAA